MTPPAIADRIRVALHGTYAHLGALGVVGALALVCGLSIFTTLDRQALQERRALRNQLKTAQTAPHVVGPLVDLPPAAVASETDFPNLPEATGVFGAIYQQALELKVPVKAAEYRYTPATESSPAQYEVAWHVRAPYLDVRVFVQDVLNSQPAVAVRELSFSRDTAAQQDLDARIRLVLFMHSGLP